MPTFNKFVLSKILISTTQFFQFACLARSTIKSWILVVLLLLNEDFFKGSGKGVLANEPALLSSGAVFLLFCLVTWSRPNNLKLNELNWIFLKNHLYSRSLPIRKFHFWGLPSNEIFKFDSIQFNYAQVTSRLKRPGSSWSTSISNSSPWPRTSSSSSSSWWWSLASTLVLGADIMAANIRQSITVGCQFQFILSTFKSDTSTWLNWFWSWKQTIYLPEMRPFLVNISFGCVDRWMIRTFI